MRPTTWTLSALGAALLLALPIAAATPGWGGKWRMVPSESGGFFDAKVLTLRQKGSRVTGTFRWRFSAEQGFGSPPCGTGHGGTLAGTVKGRKLTGRMIYPKREGYPKAVASLEITLSANGRQINGRGEMLTGECSGGVYYYFRALRVRAAG